jgi:hypothetical protein
MAPNSRITQLFKLWNRLPACLQLGQQKPGNCHGSKGRITQLFKLWNRLPTCLQLGQPPHILYSIIHRYLLMSFSLHGLQYPP